MKRFFNKLGKSPILFIVLCILCTVFVSAYDTENIGIGAGGAFYEPLINPTDSSNYIAFSDMNGLYRSDDSGASWERTETTTPLFHACFSDSGILYAGGYGLFRSTDNGKTLEMIYPDTDHLVDKLTSEDRGDHIYAEDYRSEYIPCICSDIDSIWFLAVEGTGERTVNLMSLTADGACVAAYSLEDDEIMSMASYNSSLYTYFSTDMDVTEWSSALDFKIAVTDLGICFSDKKDVYLFDPELNSISLIYSAVGEIVDLKQIGNYLYILDDHDGGTDILFTDDFVDLYDLSDYIDLPNSHSIYGEKYYFEWHFSKICGNDDDSIFLIFTSKLETDSPFDIGGVIKYDGANFHWVYDHLNYNYKAFPDMVEGFWDYSQFLGIAADPNDDDHCIVTSITSIYDLHYGDGIHSAQNLRGNEHYIDDIQYIASTGLNNQTSYFVREDPFDKDHLLLCVTDTGLHISYDGGESFRIFEYHDDFIGDTWESNCYDAYFDPNTEGLVYGLWASVHDAPYTPSLNDANANGCFAVSYDGGVTWDNTYSSGIPENSIPVKMSVREDGDYLTIAVATFNNGFYISYDSGRTFEKVGNVMTEYNGMIWGEDVVLVEDELYCLTACHDLDGFTPSALYKIELSSGYTEKIDLGEISNARSLTYDSEHGLFINVVPRLKYGFRADIDAWYYYYDCGGIFAYDNGELSQIFELQSGVYNSAFTSDGTMYATGRMGNIYIKTADSDVFDIYREGLFKHLKNVCFSNDERTMYVTSFGGGTYRIPILHLHNSNSVYTVTFIDYDGSVISTQVVPKGGSAQLPTEPTREADENYHYTFAKWDIPSDNVYSNITVTASYISEPHTKDNIYSNGDSTHTTVCEICDKSVVESCFDDDSDGYCDICGYDLNLIKLTKESGFKNGEKYLITYADNALCSSMNTQNVQLCEKNGYFTTSDKLTDNMLWTYKDGYLYTTEYGQTYYLCVNQGFGWNARNTLSTNGNRYWSNTWEYRNGSLYTMIYDGPRNTAQYIVIKNGKASLASSGNGIVIYRICE